MCLVISVFDKSRACVVSEGRRSVQTPSGFLAVREDVFKIKRLPDGSVLGLTGDTSVITELRAAIEARAGSFSETSAAISVLSEFVARYPNALISVSLIGDDGGKIRGLAWGSKMPTTAPYESAGDVAVIVQGYSETETEAFAAVSKLIARHRSLPASIAAHLTRIIADLATRHTEINTNLHFLTVEAKGKQ